jgi:UDP-glucose 4-epimerase
MTPGSVLVTGGAGFIGSHLVDALVARGARVRVVDDLRSGRRENLAAVRDRIEFVEGPAGDAGDAETIFHLAATSSVALSVERPLEVHENNVGVTLRLLTGARLRRFIFAGSCAVYGNAPTPTPEETPPAPISPYAASKLAAELYARAFGACRPIQVVCLRFFNVYGPRQDPASPYAGVIPRFIDRLRRGEPLPVFGDGLQTRDFVHVRDVVEALLAAAERGDGGVYNVGTGRATSVLELAGTLGRLYGAAARIAHRPAWPGDVTHACADVGRATAELGFSARVPLEEGLSELIKAAPGPA